MAATSYSLDKKPVQLYRGPIVIKDAGKHTLTIRLSKTLRRVLHKRRSATLTLSVTDDAGNRTTVKRTLKLRARA